MTNTLIVILIGLIVLNFLHTLLTLHRVKKIERKLPELRGDLNYTCNDAVISGINKVATSEYIVARRPARKKKEAANE